MHNTAALRCGRVVGHVSLDVARASAYKTGHLCLFALRSREKQARACGLVCGRPRGVCGGIATRSKRRVHDRHRRMAVGGVLGIWREGGGLQSDGTWVRSRSRSRSRSRALGGMGQIAGLGHLGNTMWSAHSTRLHAESAPNAGTERVLQLSKLSSGSSSTHDCAIGDGRMQLPRRLEHQVWRVRRKLSSSYILTGSSCRLRVPMNISTTGANGCRRTAAAAR